jgi:ferredoxin-NADP reductase
MQVHHIHQETPDVWTLSLLCHDYYPYRAGQYALVSVRNSADTLRAYTSPPRRASANTLRSPSAALTTARALSG